jgi:hypothetical protein
MRAQSESVVFILLFIISIFLFTFATVWSRDIFQENVDFARLESSEKFIKDLDRNIMNIIRFGGFKEMNYNLDGTIELVNSSIIGVSVPTSMELPTDWINISEDTSYIREKKEGNLLLLQVVYPPSEYRVEFFTEGPRLSQPTYVRLEKNSTFLDGETVIKIKVSFV